MNREETIVNERAREAVYRRALEVRASRTVATQGPASQAWTRTGTVRLAEIPEGVLIGRVALAEPNADVPTGDYYVGSAFHQGDHFTVFNWAARVAATFFADTGHDWCADVVGRRSFAHEGDRIADFEDIRFEGATGGPLFQARRLTVPKAPARALPTPVAAPAASPVSTPMPAPVAEPTSHRAPDAPAPRAGAPLRAEGLLRRQLRAPRTGHLGAVLATLQPDQYDLVTRRADEDLIIEGHPGTGKTVIAAHRAAYLVSRADHELDEGDAPVRRVLLVGPTDEYADHVRPAIDRLTGGSDAVDVISLRRLLATLAGVPDVPEGRAITRIEDGASEIFSFAHAAARIHRKQQAARNRTTMRLRDAYDVLRANGTAQEPITRDPEWDRYFANLPRFESARMSRMLAPMLAAIGWHLSSENPYAGYDCFIVDEAQDVMAAEWALLDAIATGNERWTLLGDLNQRRSDAALASWTHVGDLLGILDDAGDAPVATISRGYRSTAPILEFANRLLPKAERAVRCVQTLGAEVQIARVRTATLHDEAVTRAASLGTRYPDGTVAIISIEHPVTELELTKRRWRKDPDHAYRWTREGQSIDVLNPNYARGLEWDAVVVVEPARFPQNFLRHGLLYTSLTRANQELCVVHSEALPEALRGR
ncbi:AAA family ATPase [Demequina mangrovi]|uniref:UvrD-like helicase C-terminal domain-containing protein n=1 Tax=Demequina mangrovi TaxID=1043493 RepID=A0A1H6ZDC2_9MICO|nr:AAA family ATPase [Demequina mangrovi]SEJ51573.1 UvrD-like helicase C-terminal domain-containing protein [Demequina mangrovi]